MAEQQEGTTTWRATVTIKRGKEVIDTLVLPGLAEREALPKASEYLYPPKGSGLKAYINVTREDVLEPPIQRSGECRECGRDSAQLSVNGYCEGCFIQAAVKE